MASTRSALLLLALVAGCEHKSKSSQGASGAGTGSAVGSAMGSAAGQQAPQPGTVAQDPGTPTPPREVAAPTAADLATYLQDVPGSGSKLIATFETSLGAINCELFPDKAPMTVANFVGLATGKKPWMNPKTGTVETGTPYFDGLIFHRVIPEFMIQGGDPLGRGTGGPGYTFADETTPQDQMKPGTLAMANAGPGTNGSQFFITETGPDWLNGKHTIFGSCAEVDTVKKIARVPQDAQNKPDQPITMKVTIKKA